MDAGVTPRELEVLQALRAGARSLEAIARAVDPPISRRTAEAHVSSMAAKLDEDFEPGCPGFWRLVILVAVEEATGEELV